MRVSIEQFFTLRLQAGFDDVDSAADAAEHGESPEWKELEQNILDFVARIDPATPPRTAVFFLVFAQAIVETLQAVGKELGVSSIETIEY